jgi:hypothetical protein
MVALDAKKQQPSEETRRLLPARATFFPQSFDEPVDLVPGLAGDEHFTILRLRGGEIEVHRALVHRDDDPHDTRREMQGPGLAMNGLKRNPGEFEFLANVSRDLELALFE